MKRIGTNSGAEETGMMTGEMRESAAMTVPQAQALR